MSVFLFFLGIDREKIFFVGPQIFFGHSFDVETSHLSICEVFGRIGALYLAHRSGYIIFSRSLVFFVPLCNAGILHLNRNAEVPPARHGGPQISVGTDFRSLLYCAGTQRVNRSKFGELSKKGKLKQPNSSLLRATSRVPGVHVSLV